MTLTVGSLFSGIGGIDLGLERAGMKVAWQVEIDPWCRAVLAKHWPDVERFADVKEVGAHNLARVDVVAGGFPCQDISQAGRGAGIKVGTRSGLWYEYARIIRELRPRYVLVENVSMLLVRGLGIVLADLAACGYDAEWDCIPASAVGAPHRRDRLWLLAYPNGDGAGRSVVERVEPGVGTRDDLDRLRADVADADDGGRLHGQTQELAAEAGVDALGEPGTGRSDVAYPVRGGVEGKRLPVQRQPSLVDLDGGGADVAHASGERHEWPRPSWDGRIGSSNSGLGDHFDWWTTEPNVGRVAHGIPQRVDRLRGLGNAVVPQVVEWIGWRIVEADAAMTEPFVGEARPS